MHKFRGSIGIPSKLESYIIPRRFATASGQGPAPRCSRFATVDTSSASPWPSPPLLLSSPAFPFWAGPGSPLQSLRDRGHFLGQPVA